MKYSFHYCYYFLLQRTLRFYNEEDDSYETVVIEPHLRVDGTCEILAIKNGFPKDVPRSIVEHWPDIGLGLFTQFPVFIMFCYLFIRNFSTSFV